jgi:hypothetical protein
MVLKKRRWAGFFTLYNTRFAGFGRREEMGELFAPLKKQ